MLGIYTAQIGTIIGVLLASFTVSLLHASTRWAWIMLASVARCLENTELTKAHLSHLDDLKQYPKLNETQRYSSKGMMVESLSSKLGCTKILGFFLPRMKRMVKSLDIANDLQVICCVAQHTPVPICVPLGSPCIHAWSITITPGRALWNLEFAQWYILKCWGNSFLLRWLNQVLQYPTQYQRNLLSSAQHTTCVCCVSRVWQLFTSYHFELTVDLPSGNATHFVNLSSTPYLFVGWDHHQWSRGWRRSNIHNLLHSFLENAWVALQRSKDNPRASRIHQLYIPACKNLNSTRYLTLIHVQVQKGPSLFHKFAAFLVLLSLQWSTSPRPFQPTLFSHWSTAWLAL